MAPPAGTKRVKGVSIYRPFVFGSEARPIDPNKKPANLPPEHTHQWKVWVRGVDNEDISYWVKKVQFKLHETYANSLRTLDGPPFEVTETGWGEFEIQIKLHFVPESNEKPQTLWHALKLHPYGPDADAQRERRDPVVSMNYEEVVFNEPVEPFYDILTGGGVDKGKGKGKGKAAKAHASKGAAKDNHTAELPDRGPYSQEMEQRELDRMKEALKTVNKMIEEEKKRLGERETKFEELKAQGMVVTPQVAPRKR